MRRMFRIEQMGLIPEKKGASSGHVNLPDVTRPGKHTKNDGKHHHFSWENHHFQWVNHGKYR